MLSCAVLCSLLALTVSPAYTIHVATAGVGAELTCGKSPSLWIQVGVESPHPKPGLCPAPVGVQMGFCVSSLMDSYLYKPAL